MGRCPICKQKLRDALIVCRYCGEELPFRVVVVSEGSRGGGYALVKLRTDDKRKPQEK